MKTIIVNMMAGPGAGKTQTAWAIASALKKKGVIVEYVPEYAKELVWDEKFDLCDGTFKNELNIYKEQKHRIDRLIGKVQVIVTDRPLILSKLYIDKDKNTQEEYEKFINMVNEDFGKYDNMNYFVLREKDYVSAGRMQTEKEALALDEKLLNILQETPKISYENFQQSQTPNIVENIIANMK